MNQFFARILHEGSFDGQKFKKERYINEFGEKEKTVMIGAEVCSSSCWWIFPIIYDVSVFFMMRGRRGSMMCCFGPRRTKNNRISESDSASEILDKRYAVGEISREEYEEKKSVLDRDAQVHSMS